jgi:hypothetical protein
MLFFMKRRARKRSTNPAIDDIRREIVLEQKRRSSAFGRKGAAVRLVKVTAAQRTRIAKKAAAARWKKTVKKAA